MRWDDHARRLRNASSRLGTNARRAVQAVKRAGPGHSPGMVAEAAIANGELVVTGHVHLPGDRFTSVVVTVDGAAVGAVALEPPPGHDGAASSRTLWTAAVGLDGVPAGTMSIGALAVGTSGLVEALHPLTFTRPGAVPTGGTPRSAWSDVPVGRVDRPDDGWAETGGVIEVAGWAASVVTTDRIEVRLDDRPPELAGPFCDGRADVVEHTGDPRDLLSGYRHVLEIGDLPEGTACTVRVDAVGPAGRSVLGTRHVVVGPVEEPLDGDDRAWLARLADRTRAIAETRVPPHGTGLVAFTHDLGLGGAQLWLQEILRRVVAEPDVTCTVVSQRDGHFRHELEDAGVPVHITGPFPHASGAYESRVRDLVELVVSQQGNVVLANTAIAFIGIDVALRCGLPSVHAIHDHFSGNQLWHSAYGRSFLDPYVRERREATLAGASAVAFVADATRRLYLPDDDPRAVTVEYGIPMADVLRHRAGLDRAKLRSAHGFGPEDRVLVNVARVEPRKAQAALVLAFARIADAHPGAHLVIVGADGDHYSRTVRHLVHALGLDHRVRMVPLTGDVEPWYVMADGFVLPSDSESLPRTIIEAMAYELPVLASDVGGVSELVHDGETGLLVGPRDVAALAAALQRLLTLRPEHRRAMVDRAAASVRDRRDVGGYTAAFSRLLRGLAKNPGASPRGLLDEG